MRLINVDTFALQEFPTTHAAPPYSILSHTWGAEEVTFQDLVHNFEVARQKEGYAKIKFTCEQAKRDGIDWAWIDTCCIDKTSSHELSEAINSMYRWYMNATVCYVYLSDVHGHCPPLRDDDIITPSRLQWIEMLEESRWFRRGWTLQELIAPRVVLFFAQSWNFIGALPDLVQRVSGITNIQIDVLTGDRPLVDLSIARRLSWAAKRETTRVEDQAYSLFGILDVNMDLRYGEGPRAFLRLQEEIIRQSTDQSIFAWDAPDGFIESRELLLAPSPQCFINGSRIRRRRGTASESAFSISNKGLQITLPVIHRQLQDEPDRPYVTLGILDCKYEGSSDVLALVMSQHPFHINSDTRSLELYVSGFERGLVRGTQYARLLPISPSDIGDATPRLLTITKDLQSQAYIQAFNTNEATWFPLRFIGGDPDRLPSLRDVHPEECWYEGSKTMRLRARNNSYGGIVVDTNNGLSVLIGFGLYTCSVSSQSPTQSRRIFGLDVIDPECPIEPHLDELLARCARNGGERVAGLRLSRYENIVARLWRGALTVSIENATEEPTSPRLSSASSSSSPPSSPLRRSVRPPSFSSIARRDSLLQDDYSDRSEYSLDDAPSRVPRVSGCVHCRGVKARERAERRWREGEERRQIEEREAERQRREKQVKFRSNVKKTGVALSIGGVLADVAEFMV